MAAESVSPAPGTARSPRRGAAKARHVRPSSSPSTTTSPSAWPPLMRTARGPYAWIARAARLASRLAADRKAREEGRLREVRRHERRGGEKLLQERRPRGGREEPRAGAGDEDRVHDERDPPPGEVGRDEADDGGPGEESDLHGGGEGALGEGLELRPDGRGRQLVEDARRPPRPGGDGGHDGGAPDPERRENGEVALQSGRSRRVGGVHGESGRERHGPSLLCYSPAPEESPACPKKTRLPRPSTAGSTAPDFTLPARSGKTISLHDFAGQKDVLIYFYPKDDTPGCTRESCSLRDGWAELGKAGIEVLGISRDDAASHNAFAAKYNLPFELLTDADHAVHEKYGAWGQNPNPAWGVGPLRKSFLVGKDGKVKHVFDKVDTEHHAEQVLRAAGFTPAPEAGPGSGPRRSTGPEAGGSARPARAEARRAAPAARRRGRAAAAPGRRSRPRRRRPAPKPAAPKAAAAKKAVKKAVKKVAPQGQEGRREGEGQEGRPKGREEGRPEEGRAEDEGREADRPPVGPQGRPKGAEGRPEGETDGPAREARARKAKKTAPKRKAKKAAKRKKR